MDAPFIQVTHKAYGFGDHEGSKGTVYQTSSTHSSLGFSSF